MHLAELAAELRWYFGTNPGKVVRKAESDPNQYVGTFQAGGPIPARLPIIIGDCLQNLRSSLDYLVWELVLAAKNQPGENNMFPVCSTLKSFDFQLSKRHRLAGVTPDAVAEIKSLQPYHFGQDFDKSPLWVIDDLCNINKHRHVLLTHLHGGPSDIELQIINGETFGRLDLTSIKRDAEIGPLPIIDGPQGRGGQVDVNLKIAAFVAFNEGAAQNLEVGLVLGEMLKYIRFTVLPRFERFFV